jgi:hypothetical protein
MKALAYGYQHKVDCFMMRGRHGWPLNLGVASKVVLVESVPESTYVLVGSRGLVR